MAKTFLLLGAVFGFLSVAFGAFGAHGLRDSVPPTALENFKTAAQYQMAHALALVLLGLLALQTPSQWWKPAGIAFTAGICIFSGCLYLLVLTGQRWLGAIVPIGGTAFLIGWALLAYGAWRLR
ncbi:DUF423 domain-containing protein [bacterium]|nr:DUF423 domain-containing protein [bacterium]